DGATTATLNAIATTARKAVLTVHRMHTPPGGRANGSARTPAVRTRSVITRSGGGPAVRASGARSRPASRALSASRRSAARRAVGGRRLVAAPAPHDGTATSRACATRPPSGRRAGQDLRRPRRGDDRGRRQGPTRRRGARGVAHRRPGPRARAAARRPHDGGRPRPPGASRLRRRRTPSPALRDRVSWWSYAIQRARDGRCPVYESRRTTGCDGDAGSSTASMPATDGVRARGGSGSCWLHRAVAREDRDVTAAVSIRRVAGTSRESVIVMVVVVVIVVV